MSAKRTQIVDAAHQLFIEKGFALTSIQDILDKAGIAKGTFYNYFNSKNECLRAILESIAEKVDQKRRELAVGKEDSNQSVFIEQMAVRMNMNRQHHLLALFESVSLYDDAELKAFMERQHRTELRWVTKRLTAIYPKKATSIALDHAVMLMGIIHHMMHVWKLGTTDEIATEKIIRFSLERVKSMVDKQLQDKEAFLPENWLGTSDQDVIPDLTIIIARLDKLRSKVNAKDKQHELIDFLITELQANHPRTFLLEGVLLSLEKSFHQTELEQEVRPIVQMTWKLL
ncbi:TetR/AcrR family transcriptional regulator [Radiobacillus sp. PE A8.2]|uniref:TetR/AcrR family transcriptional regulator n=1 Tax=Radiobacillus sp. PE A8.2 TaxID=3380349 RepID=UPI00388D5CA9